MGLSGQVHLKISVIRAKRDDLGAKRNLCNAHVLEGNKRILSQ